MSAAQSTSLGVGQSVSVNVVQSVTEAAPSVGTMDINRTAGPTPGAGEVPIPTTECQGIQAVSYTHLTLPTNREV